MHTHVQFALGDMFLSKLMLAIDDDSYGHGQQYEANDLQIVNE